MIAYRLVLTRRHVYDLLQDGKVIAQLAFRGSPRARVTTNHGRFDLEAFEGIRKRVVRSGDHDSTIARASSLGRYAIDLTTTTLYWHSLPGRARAYCWMTGEADVVARYLPAGGGDFRVEFEESSLSGEEREHALIVGSYLLTRIGIGIGPYEQQPAAETSDENSPLAQS